MHLAKDGMMHSAYDSPRENTEKGDDTGTHAMTRQAKPVTIAQLYNVEIPIIMTDACPWSAQVAVRLSRPSVLLWIGLLERN